MFFRNITLTIFSLLLFLIIAIPTQTNAQACWDGTWTQPTCDPMVDPGGCLVSPPLFANADCDQETGNIKISDQSDTAAKSEWVDLQPGIIQLGDVQDGWNLPDPNGAIEAYGPILVGNWTAMPLAARFEGGVAAFDLYANDELRVDDNAYFYGNIELKGNGVLIPNGRDTVILNVENAGGGGDTDTLLRLTADNGEIGNFLYMDGYSNNDIYVDYLGYFNADGDFQVRIDADNNSGNSFRINNGDNNTILNLSETGYLNVESDISSTNGDISAPNGKISGAQVQGDFIETTTGNSCSGAGSDKMLYYNQSLNGWFCRDVGSGSVGGQDLLSVLQEGSDASAFAGPTSIGGKLTIVENVNNGSVDVNINNSYEVASGSNNESARLNLQLNKSGSGNGPRNAVSIVAGKDGSWWTADTVDSNMAINLYRDNSAFEALRIDSDGDVGIGTTNPSYRLQVDDGNAFIKGPDGFNAAGEEAALYLGSAPEHYIKAVYGDGLRIGTYQAADALNIEQTTGNVGIKVTNPNAQLHVCNTSNAQFIAMFNSDVDASVRIDADDIDSDSNLWFTNTDDGDYSYLIGRQDDGKFRIGVLASGMPNYDTDPTRLLTVDRYGNLEVEGDIFAPNLTNVRWRSGTSGAVADYDEDGKFTLNEIDVNLLDAETVKTSQIIHYEQSTGNKIFYGSSNCESCEIARKDCQDNRGAWEKLAQFFSVSSVNAAAIRYSGCLTVDAASCASQSCDATEVSHQDSTINYDDCGGTPQSVSYVYSRTCKSCPAGDADITKMEFYYDEGGTSRNTVEVHGDLVAPGNYHNNCETISAGGLNHYAECPEGKYITTVDFDDEEVTCCRL